MARESSHILANFTAGCGRSRAVCHTVSKVSLIDKSLPRACVSQPLRNARNGIRRPFSSNSVACQ